MTVSSTARHWGREVLRWALLSALIVAIVSIFQFRTGGLPALSVVLQNLGLGFLVCFAISALAWTLMPRIARRIGRYHPALRWMVLVSVMTACGVVGFWVALGALYLSGFLPGTLIPVVFRENIVGVVTVTLILGTVFTILCTTQERLEATELSLQTQRLERERAEKLAAEARLASLSSRVQPHF